MLMTGIIASAQQIERTGRNVPGRGPAFQLPPLPEYVVYSVRDSSGRTFDGRSSNNAPIFFIYPDEALDSVSAVSLVSALGLHRLVSDFHASAFVINPSGGRYDDEADFDAFVWMFNRSRPGNLKVIGLGEGASFVNRVLLPRAAGHIAGILSVDGKPCKSAAGDSDGVPAYIAGKNAMRAAAAYISADGAQPAASETEDIAIYENPGEPLLRVAVDSDPVEDLAKTFEDAWNVVLSRNFRYSNFGHTHYMGAKFGEYGAYELEPYTIWERLGIVRNVVVQERAGGLPWLWYEYWPEELMNGAVEASVPVMVLLHGNANDPRTQAETSGFIEVAAKERFFVVEMEWQGSRSAGAMGLDGIESVLYGLFDKYPQLDPSRVYCEGLSAGSMTSTLLGVRKSHLFAAVGGHSGGLFGLSHPASDYRSIMAEAAHKRGCVEMPYCSVFGTADDVVPFFTEDNYEDNSYLNAWNAYRLMNGLEMVSDLDFSKDPTFGFSLSDRMTIDSGKQPGITMEFGQLYKGEIPIIRIVAVNDYGHWNFKPTAQIMWDFFRHFSRDQKTFELIYTP